MFCKELARLAANFSKIVTYFIICMLIGMSRFYIPGEYRIAAFLLFPAALLGWKQLIWAVVCSPVITLFSLYKCFKA